MDCNKICFFFFRGPIFDSQNESDLKEIVSLFKYLREILHNVTTKDIDSAMTSSKKFTSWVYSWKIESKILLMTIFLPREMYISIEYCIQH